MTDFITEATLRQQEAASPDSSAFVSANAGTGKTKVLTDRVLRLLISGALPQSILCMTFTKAAAVEMTVRLNQRLADWAVCDETKLIENLISMGEARPKQEQILRARALFAKIADTDDGPRIETVHSFCQSILGRFPIEAGIPPHFQLVTEIEGDQLLQKTLHKLLQFPSTLTEALSVVAGYSDERQLFSMIVVTIFCVLLPLCQNHILPRNFSQMNKHYLPYPLLKYAQFHMLYQLYQSFFL